MDAWGVDEREGLRNLCVFSEDPSGCKDIDDTLHAPGLAARCSPLPSGNLEVGVHIADVTNFLPPGCAMDDEAQRRATS
eukprot:178056-Chlamydomonas_euryale.AAC.1